MGGCVCVCVCDGGGGVGGNDPSVRSLVSHESTPWVGISVIHDFANVTLAMSDGFDRVVPSPSWGLLCFALPGNFNVYLERIEVQREKLALSFDLQRQNLFFETNGRERSLCSLGLRQRSTQEKQVSKRRLKYFSLTE